MGLGLGWWQLLRREEGIAHEPAGDDGPLGEGVAAEGGGPAVELGHLAHAHAAHLGPELDLARLLRVKGSGSGSGSGSV